MKAEEILAQDKVVLGEGHKSESAKDYLEKKVYPILQTALLDVLLRYC